MRNKPGTVVMKYNPTIRLYFFKLKNKQLLKILQNVNLEIRNDGGQSYSRLQYKSKY